MLKQVKIIEERRPSKFKIYSPLIKIKDFLYKMKIFLIIFLILTTLSHKKNNIKFIEILPSINSNYDKPKNLKELFKSRQLFITDANITNEYINYIKPLNEKKFQQRYKKFNSLSIYNLKFDENYFIKRKDQLKFEEFGKLCVEEKLLYKGKIKASNNPLISVILPSFNKKEDIMKSIRSVQNQSLRNIEIIIVDDCSTDGSSKYFKKLLKTDPRIRLFTHLKNMGVWRARISGLLYSRGKYVIHFDTGDLYEDNYVLEDGYNVINKYDLDSIKMFFRLIYDFHNLTNNDVPFNYKINYTNIANKSNIVRYNRIVFGPYYGVIWHRLIRSDVYIKGLNLLSDEIINIYKNLWEDRWWTKIGDVASNNQLIIKRFSYLYYKDYSRDRKPLTLKQKDNVAHEFLYFINFDLEFEPKESNKKGIIKRLENFCNNKIKMENFRTRFEKLDNLIIKLIKDPYVNINDKIILNKLLNVSLTRQIMN